MNPFLWTGPHFLGFYVALVLAILAWLAWTRRNLGQAATDRVRLQDPLAVALLRAGREQTVLVAALALRDAGCWLVVGNRVVADPDAPPPDLPLARVLRDRWQPGRTVAEFLALPEVQRECATVEEALRRDRLLPDAEERSAHHRFVLSLVGILAGVALTKVVFALTHGHHNIGFLVLLLAISLPLTWWFGVRGLDRLTSPAGRQALAQLRLLLGRAQDRKTEGRLLTAALFGLGALGGAETDLERALNPAPVARTDRDHDTSGWSIGPWWIPALWWSTSDRSDDWSSSSSSSSRSSDSSSDGGSSSSSSSDSDSSSSGSGCGGCSSGSSSD